MTPRNIGWLGAFAILLALLACAGCASGRQDIDAYLADLNERMERLEGGRTAAMDSLTDGAVDEGLDSLQVEAKYFGK